MIENLTFLYVEDDPSSRKVMDILMTKALKIKNIFIFENSRDFQSRLASLNPAPDIILLDIHVDPLDGFEMLEIVRQTAGFQTAKVIALTASVMNEEVERLRSSGFDGAISKPLSMTVFPDLIRRISNNESIWHIA